MEKHLHIVCLDVPYPVDYGGVFDLFYKIKALHEQGVKIHLHCFEYGRGEQPALQQYCVEVNYYNRNRGHKGFSNKVPYIVSSRSNQLLIDKLLKDDHPVLLEGIHCTWPLYSESLKGRKVFLRLHNVEHEYYYHLALHERSLIRKIYCYNESRLLKAYESWIANQAPILAVAENDVATYHKKFGAKDIVYLPVFIPFQQVKGLPGLGTYCLYHGNLSIAENEKAAVWLLEEVFERLKIPFIIAGKKPSARLKRLMEHCFHTCLIEDPGEHQMNDLIAKAQINVLPSFNATGIKLKLLNALYNGRHCLVNDATIEQTGLEQACHIANNAAAFREKIVQLYDRSFNKEEVELREKLLSGVFNNTINAVRLIHLIYENNEKEGLNLSSIAASK